MIGKKNFTRQMKLLVGCIVLLAIVSSCSIFEGEEDLPAYLYVNPFVVEPGDPDKQGSGSALVPYGWVYADGVFFGAFELPVKVPVVGEGPAQITVLPGIRDNGSVITPQVYAFYDRYQENLNLAPLQVDTIYPVTRYLDDLNFVFLEDFEGGHPFVLDVQGNQVEDLTISFEPPQPFEGGAGQISVDLDQPVKSVITQNTIVGLPTNGTPVYLELNYLTDVNLRVGLIAFDAQGMTLPLTTLVLRPNQNWNKAYFSLADPLNAVVGRGVAYKVVLSAELPADNEGFTLSSGDAFVDNVKLITF